MHKIALESACDVIIRTLWLRRSDLHLCESQRVPFAFPVIPLNASPFRVRVAAIVIETVETGVITRGAVPPGTFVCHCTRVWPPVVVLVLSAELVSEMSLCQRITFKQQTVYTYISQVTLMRIQLLIVHVVNVCTGNDREWSRVLTQAYVIKIPGVNISYFRLND